MSPPRIGVLLGSTRSARLNPEIAEYIVGTINNEQWKYSFEISVIDLQAWNLPMFDEPKIPATIKRSEDYTHEITRRWSKEISSYESFIIIAPQYNWGYPACLKNAIDYLYNEWAGKPVMIVTYGGHGGHKCYAQLKQVLDGLNMKVAEKGVLVPYPTKNQIMHGVSDDFLFEKLPNLHEQIIEAFAEFLPMML